MLQRGLSAHNIIIWLFSVDLLPLMLAKMCQLCLFFLPARFLIDLCSFVVWFLLSMCSTYHLPLIMLYSARGRGFAQRSQFHGFNVLALNSSCVRCLGAVVHVYIRGIYIYISFCACMILLYYKGFGRGGLPPPPSSVVHFPWEMLWL